MIAMIAMDAAESDEMDTSRVVSGGPGSTSELLREALRTLSRAAGYPPEALVEWSSADAPGAPTDLPPLHYAALLPDARQVDMPLGLGDTPAAALTDLLWTLGGSALLADLRQDGTTPDESGATEAADATDATDAAPVAADAEACVPQSRAASREDDPV
jgi:hypothetical protein